VSCWRRRRDTPAELAPRAPTCAPRSRRQTTPTEGRQPTAISEQAVEKLSGIRVDDTVPERERIPPANPSMSRATAHHPRGRSGVAHPHGAPRSRRRMCATVRPIHSWLRSQGPAAAPNPRGPHPSVRGSGPSPHPPPTRSRERARAQVPRQRSGAPPPRGRWTAGERWMVLAARACRAAQGANTRRRCVRRGRGDPVLTSGPAAYRAARPACRTFSSDGHPPEPSDGGIR
jgi:hypothetical protein